MRTIGLLLIVIVLALAGVYVAAGFRPGPVIDVAKPTRFVGATSPLEVTVDTPGRRLSSLTIEFEQNSKVTPLFTYAPAAATIVASDPPD